MLTGILVLLLGSGYIMCVIGAGGNDDSRRIVFHGGYAHGGGWFGGSGVPRVEGEEPADGGACGVCGGAGGAGNSAAVLMIIATKKGIVSEIVDAIPLRFNFYRVCNYCFYDRYCPERAAKFVEREKGCRSNVISHYL